MECKKVELNKGYYVKITFNNDIHRLYVLYDEDDVKKCESFNRDGFLIKASQYINITSKQENVIASY